MIKFDLSTPKGLNFSRDDIKIIVCHFESGEFAVLKDHIPIIAASSTGYVKIEADSQVRYIAFKRAIFEFQNNHARLICNTASLDDSLEKANMNLDQQFNDLVNKSKEEQKQFLLNEKELRDSILKSKAGNL